MLALVMQAIKVVNERRRRAAIVKMHMTLYLQSKGIPDDLLPLILERGYISQRFQ